MIIATIGHQDYQLKTIDQAEALLNILGLCTPIDRNYNIGAYVEDTTSRMLGTSVEIKIVHQEKPLTEEEAAPLIEVYERKKRKKKAESDMDDTHLVGQTFDPND